MASRESQGLQIALILFVMVTCVLALTTYLYFRKAEEKVREAREARADAQQAKDAAMQMQFENQVMKHVLGYDVKTQAELDTIKQSLGGNKDMEKVFTGFDQDMAMYGVGFAGQALNYRTLPAHLIDAVNRRSKNLVDAGAREKSLVTEREQAKAAEAARTQKAERGLQTAQSELATERKSFNDHRTRTTTEKDKIAAILPKKDQEIQRLSGTMQTEIENRDRAISQLTQLYEALKDKAERQKEPTYESPDGEIVMVNTSSNLVWIDLGSADGVNRMMTFSVIDQNETGVGTAPVKARIEVTQVKDVHRAEARILDNELTDPIMKGDKIYSPSFRKGQKTHFALAGFLDINGDGRSDQTKVKSIITMNNGVVDAELLDDGSIAGKMTVDTHYIVKGDAPTDRTNERLTQGFSKIVGEASRLGIQNITLATLLDRMGYHDERRVIDLQRGGPGGSGASKKFRKRSPSSAY